MDIYPIVTHFRCPVCAFTTSETRVNHYRIDQLIKTRCCPVCYHEITTGDFHRLIERNPA